MEKSVKSARAKRPLRVKIISMGNAEVGKVSRQCKARRYIY